MAYEFSKEHFLITSALYEGNHTLSEISEYTELDKEKVKSLLEELLKYRIVKKIGDKYYLSRTVLSAYVANREKNKFGVRLAFEVFGNSEKDVKEALDEIASLLKGFDWIEIKYIDVVGPEKEDNSYAGFVDVDIVVESVSDLFRIVSLVVPTYIEIYHPHEFKINAIELQSGLTLLSQKLLSLVVSYHKERLKNNI